MDKTKKIIIGATIAAAIVFLAMFLYYRYYRQQPQQKEAKREERREMTAEEKALKKELEELDRQRQEYLKSTTEKGVEVPSWEQSSKELDALRAEQQSQQKNIQTTTQQPPKTWEESVQELDRLRQLSK